jgi:hypothetical protein
MPAPNFIGADSFTYKANDGYADSNVATVSLVITSPCTVRPARGDDGKEEDENEIDWEDNCKPGTPIAENDRYAAKQDVTLTVPAIRGVLRNDGRLAVAALLVQAPAHGTVTLNLDGSFVYQPAAGYYGLDSFLYAARSASGIVGPVATVRIVVRKNLPPDADNDFYATRINTTLTIVSPGVLKNDSDPDGDALTAVLVTGPSHGALTLSTNGGFVYKPAANFAGTDTFTYNAVDTFGHADMATVSIRVSRSGDDGDHGREESHHRDGDGCDHERGLNGHFKGDGCEHDRRR